MVPIDICITYNCVVGYRIKDIWYIIPIWYLDICITYNCVVGYRIKDSHMVYYTSHMVPRYIVSPTIEDGKLKGGQIYFNLYKSVR